MRERRPYADENQLADEIAESEFRRAMAADPPEAPDLLPELHDVPLTDLDTDRDTELRAEERDRRWEELNARD